MDAILYKVDGTKKNVKINSFVEARKIVCNYDSDGLAQIIHLGNGTLLLIDEEGKLKNFAVNSMATNLAHLNDAIYPHDCIVGDALMFQNENEFEEMDYE